MANGKNNPKKPTKRDAFIGFIIPMVFIGLAIYEEVYGEGISQWVVMALIIFGLAAAGNRFDGAIARILELQSQRSSAQVSTPNEQSNQQSNQN
jgi:hypothetical protein